MVAGDVAAAGGITGTGDADASAGSDAQMEDLVNKLGNEPEKQQTIYQGTSPARVAIVLLRDPVQMYAYSQLP